jgi:hypothetical protein
VLNLDCNHSRRQQQQRHQRDIVGKSWAKALVQGKNWIVGNYIAIMAWRCAKQLKESIVDGYMGLGNRLREKQVLKDVVGDNNDFYWGRM